MVRLLSIAGLALLVAATPPDDRGRPVILLVHGRGMAGRDSAAMRAYWSDALRAGARAIAGEPVIAERDVRVVWYADVLDPRSAAGCEYRRDDPRAHRDATEDADLKSLVSSVGNLLGELTGLISDDSEVTTQLRGLASDASFLSDAHKRCASERRLADAIDRARGEGRPVIVVAHSLGSLVAYDYLSTRADSVLVQRLVTIGSMLGSPELRHVLIGGDSTDTLSRPPSVRDWVNVRNEEDPLAVPLTVARDIVANPPPDEVDPHEMVGYLHGSATANAVVSGWCAAFATNRPPACGKVAPN